MIDDTMVTELKLIVCDRYTPEELIELLGVSTGEVFERFYDEVLELNILEEVL